MSARRSVFSEMRDVLSVMPHGWCSVRKAETLLALVMGARPRLVVEIGVYAGRSYVPMVMGLHEIGAGVAVGIDPYDAKVSAEGESAANAQWWGGLDHGLIRKALYTVLQAAPEWTGRWQMLEESSTSAHWRVGSLADECEGIGLLHVDGSHTEQAIMDVVRYAALVHVGGFVVLDDLLWDSGAVSASVEHLRMLGFEERYRMVGAEEGTAFTDNWGVFQRVTAVTADGYMGTVKTARAT